MEIDFITKTYLPSWHDYEATSLFVLCSLDAEGSVLNFKIKNEKEVKNWKLFYYVFYVDANSITRIKT